MKRGKATRVLILNNFRKIPKSKPRKSSLKFGFSGHKNFTISRRSQLQISFGMIFSIILIIAFIAVAIYAIIIFLKIGKCANTGLFKDRLQEEINRAWNSDEANFIFKENLDDSIEKACFVDLARGEKGENEELYKQVKKLGLINVNMFFYPLNKACEGQKAFLILHLNITEITKQKNPNCFDNVKGKINLKIEKGFYESLVRLS